MIKIHPRLSVVLRRTLGDLAILFIPGSLWAICYAREIIELIFRRADYLSAVPVFRIFQVALLLFVVNNLLGTGVLVAFHRDHTFRNVLAWSTMVFLIVCPLLTWMWGNTGAATAVMAIQILCLVWFSWEIRGLVRPHLTKALGLPLVVGLSAASLSLGLHLSWLVALIPTVLAYVVLAVSRTATLAQRAR